MRNLERRLRHLEQRLADQYCTHEKLAPLQRPVWMRVDSVPPPWEIEHLRKSLPADPEPIAGRCVACGQWFSGTDLARLVEVNP